MNNYINNYLSNIHNLLDSIRVTDKSGLSLKFSEGIEEACNTVIFSTNNGGKLIFIGNGASAAFSSHMSTDFWKNGGMRAIAFNDSSLLTCISNDFGYNHVFEKPVEMFGDRDDILIAISSSGKSENILAGVNAAREKRCRIITLSGFDENNPLSLLGDLNFFVPDHKYGPVEIVHQFICHCILDMIMDHIKK